MSKWFGRNVATPPSSPAKIAKRKVVPDPSAYMHRPDISPAASSRAGITSTPTPLLRVSGARQPYSQTEVYWASRALRSETLLVAQATHHHEVREVLSSAEITRARELSKLRREHDARQSRLEAVVLGLCLSLLLLAIIVFYLLAKFPRQRMPETTRWNVPHHFTIPVLSPFTSVVEAESAVIGGRSIAILIVVSGAVIYGLIRYWMDHRAKK